MSVRKKYDKNVRKTYEQVETHTLDNHDMMLMVINMECPRCHNKDNDYFFRIKDDVYCRKCIQFSRVNVNEIVKTTQLDYPRLSVEYALQFDLSLKQKEIALQLLENYKNHLNSYVNVVCGGGKTELVFDVIKYTLSCGHRVCFCVPRKELVRELYERIQKAFDDVDIGVFYGGVQKNPLAQFIVCTMHQLYRFEKTGFQLMIADEIDAFPFYGNEVLNAIFDHCVKGNFIKMSATFDDEDVKDGKMLIMNRRYHGYDLPLPRSIICPLLLQKLFIVILLLYVKRRWIIYVPTIETGEELYRFLKKFITDISFVSSRTSHNSNALHALKTKLHYILISTTLLERGITVENVHVIVYQGEHQVFDTRTLIQIAGRVGRKPDYHSGDVIILHSHRSREITKCIKIIKEKNNTA